MGSAVEYLSSICKSLGFNSPALQIKEEKKKIFLNIFSNTRKKNNKDKFKSRETVFHLNIVFLFIA
jgi:hypothetical protein